MAGWAVGQRCACHGARSSQQGALRHLKGWETAPRGTNPPPRGCIRASKPGPRVRFVGSHPASPATRLEADERGFGGAVPAPGQGEHPWGWGERTKPLGTSPEQQDGRAVPRAAPLPSASSSLAPTVAAARSWGKDLKIVVGPVYASSAKRLINAAGTENQFFKAEINNNN